MLLTRAGWLLLHCVLASAWVHLVVRRAKCGWPRLLLAAPVLAGNTLAPLLFSRGDEVCTRVATAFSLAWLSNAKVHQHCSCTLGQALWHVTSQPSQRLVGASRNRCKSHLTMPAVQLRCQVDSVRASYCVLSGPADTGICAGEGPTGDAAERAAVRRRASPARHAAGRCAPSAPTRRTLTARRQSADRIAAWVQPDRPCTASLDVSTPDVIPAGRSDSYTTSQGIHGHSVLRRRV